ncbi:F390 synthetase-related protein [Leucobacter viscericola]|nr:F390 synthetase-related protein [Leucobacter viscericola]
MLVITFVRSRWGYRFRTRQQLKRFQDRRWRRFARTSMPRANYYVELTHHHGSLPIISKPDVRRNFAGMNTRSVTLEHALEVARTAERNRDFSPTIGNDLTVGLSSGTSGTQGAFLVSSREQALWAGTILARVLSSDSLRRLLTPWAEPVRISFFLRANSNLYESVASRRVSFEFCDLLEPIDAHIEALNRSRPNIIVAPASVLKRLADAQGEGRLRVRPNQVVSVAEVLEPADAELMFGVWGAPVSQVYQATEGLLAVTCSQGTLHMCEERVIVEPEWLDPERTRFHPVITDLQRTTQLIVRYRLDDVLRVREGEPCPCGSVALALAGVEGRADEVVQWPSTSGGSAVTVFPDVLRRTMSLAGRHFDDWRYEQETAEQTPSQEVQSASTVIRLLNADRAAEDAVQAELTNLANTLLAQPPRLIFAPWVEPQPGAKLRRITRLQPVSGEAGASPVGEHTA